MSTEFLIHSHFTPSGAEQVVAQSVERLDDLGKRGTTVRFTVAICTWNRAALLKLCLQQFTKLAVPERLGWELLVVNNNSSDSTDQVIDEFRSRLPIRRLLESTPGKSHALNRAIVEARGQYILWTDDDALVDSQWLVAYDQAFREWPEAAVFGGPVDPWFSRPPPMWLQRVWPRVKAAYAAVDYGPQVMSLSPDRVPFGVNMAVRTDDQRRYAYDPRKGPRPGSSLRGEETAVVRQLLADRATGWWVPGARVRHYIPPERQTTRYLRAYFEGQGLYQGLFHRDLTSRQWFGRPRWLFRQALVGELRYRLLRAFVPPERWISDLIRASTAWGCLRAPRALADQALVDWRPGGSRGNS